MNINFKITKRMVEDIKKKGNEASALAVWGTWDLLARTRFKNDKEFNERLEKATALYRSCLDLEKKGLIDTEEYKRKIKDLELEAKYLTYRGTGNPAFKP